MNTHTPFTEVHQLFRICNICTPSPCPSLTLSLSLSHTYYTHTHSIYTHTIYTQFSELSRYKFWTLWYSHLQKIQHISWEWGQLFSIIAVKVSYPRNVTLFLSLIGQSIAEFPPWPWSILFFICYCLLDPGFSQGAHFIFDLHIFHHLFIYNVLPPLVFLSGCWHLLKIQASCPQNSPESRFIWIFSSWSYSG